VLTLANVTTGAVSFTVRRKSLKKPTSFTNGFIMLSQFLIILIQLFLLLYMIIGISESYISIKDSVNTDVKPPDTHQVYICVSYVITAVLNLVLLIFTTLNALTILDAKIKTKAKAFIPSVIKRICKKPYAALKRFHNSICDAILELMGDLKVDDENSGDNTSGNSSN